MASSWGLMADFISLSVTEVTTSSSKELNILTRAAEPFFVASRTVAIWKSLPPACETLRNWHSINMAICSPAITTQTPVTKLDGFTLFRMEIPVGVWNTNTFQTEALSTVKKFGTLITITHRHTSSRLFATSPTVLPDWRIIQAQECLQDLTIRSCFVTFVEALTTVGSAA